MKKYTRQDLKENAERLLSAHGKNKIFATVDGNFFFAEHDATNHNALLQQDFPTETLKVEAFEATLIDEAETAAKEAAEKEAAEKEAAEKAEAETAAKEAAEKAETKEKKSDKKR